MQSRNILIGLVASAAFMEGLDSTIVSTALPQIATSLSTDPLHLKVALTTYLLSAGIIIPVSGWLADRFGSRAIFSWALLIFLIGSIACGFAQNLTELVIARAVQGMGGALSLPVGRLLFVRTFKKHELAAVLSLTATFGLIGPSLGPVIGGALTTFVSWRAIFFVNIPIGLAGFYFARKHIQNYRDPHIQQFDFVGFLILSLALAAILISLDTIIDPIMNVFTTYMMLLAGVLGLILYALYARRTSHAILSAKLFKRGVFLQVITGSIFARFAMSASPFLVPLLLQVGFGYSPLISGVFTAASAIGMLMTKFFIRQMLERYGYRNILVVNAGLYSIILLFLSALSLHPPVVVMVIILFLNGVVASVQFSAMNTLAYANIPSDAEASGASFISGFQQILNSFGIAISALILQLFLTSRGILHANSLPAFTKTFLCLTLFPLISILIFSQLPRVQK